MLPKKERLSREEFTQAFSRGRKTHTAYASIITHKAADFKAAVVVPKKVYKSAVTRNRMRRRVYGLLKPLCHNRTHYIVILKPAARSVPFAVLKESLLLSVGLQRHSR